MWYQILFNSNKFAIVNYVPNPEGSIPILKAQIWTGLTIWVKLPIAIPRANKSGEFSTCYIVSLSSEKMHLEKLFRPQMWKTVDRSLVRSITTKFGLIKFFYRYLQECHLYSQEYCICQTVSSLEWNIT